MLLSILPTLVFATMIYPAGKKYTGRENCRKGLRDAIRSGMVVWDIIDMAELMFGDIGCFQTYGTAWLTVFYIALGISAFLIAFSSYGLEQESANGKEGWADYCVTGSNLVFNDLLFLILRLKTMTTQKSFYIEWVFVIKEAMGVIARSGLLLTAFCEGEKRPKNKYYLKFNNEDEENTGV